MNQEAIEQYLHNEMSPEERAAFEQALAADPALAAELRAWQQVEQTVTAIADAKAGMPALQQTLAGLNPQYFKQKEQAPVVPLRSNRKRWYAGIAAAAAMVVAVVVLTPLLKSDAGPDWTALYTTYGKYQPIGSGTRSGGATETQTADSLFDAGDYQAALPLLVKINAQNPADMERKLALGVCYSKTGNAEKAIRIFDSVAMDKSAGAATAVWYKALHYLAQKDAAGCRKVLEAITNQSEYYKEAQELLKKL